MSGWRTAEKKGKHGELRSEKSADGHAGEKRGEKEEKKEESRRAKTSFTAYFNSWGRRQNRRYSPGGGGCVTQEPFIQEVWFIEEKNGKKEDENGKLHWIFICTFYGEEKLESRFILR